MNMKKESALFSPLRLMALFLLSVASWLSQPCFATEVDADCHALKLKKATGVPQNAIHTYEFTGTCNINALPETGPTVLQAVPANASATWDGSKQEFTESFHILGPVYLEGWVKNGSAYKVDITPGEVKSTFKCNDDPLLSGNVACLTAFHENLSGFAPFSNPAKKQNRPLLKGKTSLAEATKLSKLYGPPPGPSPSSPKVMSSPSGKTSSKNEKSPVKGVLGGALKDAVPPPNAIVKERVSDATDSGRRAVQGAVSRIPSIPSVGRSTPNSTTSNSPQATGQVATATQGSENAAAASIPGSAGGTVPPSVSGRGTGVPQQTPANSPSKAATQSSPGTMRSAAQAMLLNVEGEDLAKNGKILLAGGQVTSQAMSGFGTGWSGNGQLFWSGGSVGAVLDLLIDVPAAASYALEFYPTRAPDYGQIKIQVDGQDSPVTVDGYSPRVMQPTPRQLGRFSLSQGEHKISFMIVGKNPMATGYLVGIDRIRLYPSGPYVAGSK